MLNKLPAAMMPCDAGGEHPVVETTPDGQLSVLNF